MRSLKVRTQRRTELVEITEAVARTLSGTDTGEGACFVYCPHTTAGLLINERADPAVAHDVRGAFDRLIPQEGPWTHAEGNSPAHVKASLVGSSVLVPLVDGALQLGTWQGIFLAEFDGPRERVIQLRILS